MGLFKKLGDLARSNINAFLDQIEDKKKLSEQAILDLEDSKKKAKKLLISAMASLKLADLRKAELEKKIGQLVADAEQALTQNNEENARVILAEKQALLVEIETLAEQIAKERAAISALNQGLLAIDKKVANLRTSMTLSAGRDEIENEDAFATFSRMEEKIDFAEHEVQALNELLAESEKSEQDPKPPATFDKHSDPIALEKEIAALKTKLKR
ncbi:MAG TPA: PspA/IM30 family protein [Myxococcota bacterium]|nr:PspA/IM30 family protein [Myxococcota bacterium]